MPSWLSEARGAEEQAAFATELAYLMDEIGAEYMETVLPEVTDWPPMAAAAAHVVRGHGVRPEALQSSR